MVRKINLMLLKTLHGRVFDGFKLWKTIPDDRVGNYKSASKFEVFKYDIFYIL